ncbi:TPA: hypothetical protein DEQ89_05620 [Candidatus Daviesbacteria bacterium]|nr:hypothetical protein [Candidatus Daviesbacteria bacterium]
MPTTKIIKFGKGAAIVIPPEYMKERNIKVGDTVNFEVYPLTNPLSKLWGRGKHLKIDAQKAKDELRKEWHDERLFVK